ncbi:MAG: hypothetical protein MCS20_01165 [Candidatus Phytoplasma mali]|nr:hypothetical protein [Candidatus Phytoplasma mali]
MKKNLSMTIIYIYIYIIFFFFLSFFSLFFLSSIQKIIPLVDKKEVQIKIHIKIK